MSKLIIVSNYNFISINLNREYILNHILLFEVYISEHKL